MIFPDSQLFTFLNFYHNRIQDKCLKCCCAITLGNVFFMNIEKLLIRILIKKVSKSLCRAILLIHIVKFSTNLNVTNNIEHWLIQILPDALLEFLYLFRNKSVSFGLWNFIGWLEVLCSATQGINFFLICCI